MTGVQTCALPISRILDAIALQRAQIIRVTKFRAQLLEDGPVTLRALVADGVFEMALEVGGDTVVFEQRVVHVEEEDDFVRGHKLGRMLPEFILTANDFKRERGDMPNRIFKTLSHKTSAGRRSGKNKSYKLKSKKNTGYLAVYFLRLGLEY